MATIRPRNTTRVLGMVFSRHRAMQLDATLHSLMRHCIDPDLIDLKVLYRNDTREHDGLYQELIHDYQQVAFVHEHSFREQVLDLLSAYQYVLFLVDDNIFVRGFSVRSVTAALDAHANCVGFSLRLGRNTNYCNPRNRPQALPSFQETDQKGILSFRWVGGELDFGYPLEVSSSLYRVSDLLHCLEIAQFRSPNTLEDALVGIVPSFGRSHPNLLCLPTSCTFCAPLNRVQNTHPNRCGSKRQWSAESLRRQFARGLRIDTDRLQDFLPRGCHQEVDLVFRQHNAQSNHSLETPRPISWHQRIARPLRSMVRVLRGH